MCIKRELAKVQNHTENEETGWILLFSALFFPVCPGNLIDTNIKEERSEGSVALYEVSDEVVMLMNKTNK